MTTIQIDHLNYQYPTGNFQLSIDHLLINEPLVAIAGQNGAGKSTLFNLLAGLVQPTSGEIKINQYALANLTPIKRLQTIGIIFQNPNLQLFNLTVEKEVAWGLAQLKLSPEIIKTTVSRALSKVGLTPLKDQNPFDLSFSEKKLLTIATVIAIDPKIILFDEPMMSLDFPNRQLVTRLMKQLVHENHQVIVITHDMDWLAATFSRTIVLSAGQVNFQGTPTNLFAQPELVKPAGLLSPKIMTIAKTVFNDPNVYLTPQDYWRKHQPIS